MRLKNNPGFAVATAAAMLFGSALTGTAFAADAATMHCAGVNSCKGQGFLELSKKDCEAAKAKAK